MISRLMFGLALAGSLTTGATAATTVAVTQAATTNKPGFTTLTMTANTTDGVFTGFDFVGNGTNYGFFGPMNQINPGGNSSVFNNSNGFFSFVGASVDQDSQFKYDSGTVIVINPAESANKLQAAFDIGAGSLGATTSFVQIAMRDTDTVSYNGTATIRGSNGAFLVPISGTLVVPEPASLVLVALGGLAMLGRRRTTC